MKCLKIIGLAAVAAMALMAFAGEKFKVSINTVLFGSCVYTAGEGTDMSTLKGNTGNATMEANAVVTKVSGICNNTGKWVATYSVTSPSPLWVEAS